MTATQIAREVLALAAVSLPPPGHAANYAAVAAALVKTHELLREARVFVADMPTAEADALLARIDAELES